MRTGGNDLLCACTHKTHLGESLQVNVSYVRQRGAEGLKDEFLGVVGLRQMCTRDSVLRAEGWRLRLACADFLNDTLLLAAKGICAHFALLMVLGRPFSLLEAVRAQMSVSVEEEQL